MPKSTISAITTGMKKYSTICSNYLQLYYWHK